MKLPQYSFPVVDIKGIPVNELPFKHEKLPNNLKNIDYQKSSENVKIFPKLSTYPRTDKIEPKINNQ